MRNFKIIIILFLVVCFTKINAQTADSTVIQAKHLYTQLCVKEKNPLYVVNGFVFDISDNILASISSEDIEKMHVLKDGAAIEKYGDKGKDGVIVITLRKVC